MLLYWVGFIYHLGREGEPWPSLSIIGGLYCVHSSRVYSTGFLMVLNFYISSRLRTSGPQYMWGNSEWKFFWIWFPGTTIGRGLVQSHPPTAGALLWFNVLAPWTLRCTGVWTKTKWWKLYSWRICTSSSMVDDTLLLGVCISSSGYPPPPYPVSHE